MNSLKAGLEKASNVVSNVTDTAKDKARALSEDAKDKVNVVKNVAIDKASDVKNKVKDASLNLAKSVATTALKKVGDKVVNAAVLDPDMPGIVKQGIASIVRDVIKEVQVEVEQQLEGTWAGKDKGVADDIMAKRNPLCCPNPIHIHVPGYYIHYIHMTKVYGQK